MKLLPAVFYLLICTTGMAQVTDKNLKQQLDSVYTLDQKYRAMLTFISQPGSADAMAKKLTVPVPQAVAMLQIEQAAIDSANFVLIEKLISKYGYPGKTLVGEPSNEIAWNVIDHANKITKYLPLIKQQAEKNEIPFYLYATMLDRYLSDQGKAQIYGTQCTCATLITAKKECFVWPIENAAAVNERRKKAGFKITVEQNAQRFGISYRPLRLDEIQLPLNN